jgi:hypothetical protein
MYARVELVDFISESDPEALHIMTSRELNKVKTNYLLYEGSFNGSLKGYPLT